jgi:hypothetical protein
VAARGLIKRRDAHEAMHASFAHEHPIGIFTGKLDGGVLDARLFAGSLIENDGAHALAFGPSQIHAQQDGGPVLRFGAAGAGLDGHDGVEVIAFAGEQRFGFQVGDVIFGVAELAVELFQQVIALPGIGFFLREVNVSVQVAGKRSELFVGGDLILGAFAVTQDGLRGFLIVPEIGRGNA